MYFRWKRIVSESSKLMLRISLHVKCSNIVEVLEHFRTLPFNTINVSRKIDFGVALYGKLTKNFDENLMAIIQFHSSHLQNLIISQVNLRICLDILKLSKNIQELQLEIQDQESFADKEIIHLPNLKSLKIYGDSEIMKFIRAENLIVFVIYTKLEATVLKNFLANSSNLKALITKNSVKDFQENDMKLQKLVCNFNTNNHTSIIEFLDKQKSTLKGLMIDINFKSSEALELIKCVLNHLSLRQLSMNFDYENIDLSSLQTNDTITELCLNGIKNKEHFKKIMSFFRSVTKLELFLKNSNESFDLQTIQEVLPDLKTFTLNGCNMNISKETSLNSLEHLTILTFSGINYPHQKEWFDMASICPNIRTLKYFDWTTPISMNGLEKVLMSCKYLEVIDVWCVQKIGICDHSQNINLNKSSNLKSINVYAPNINEVIQDMKKCSTGSSKIRAITEIEERLIHKVQLKMFMPQCYSKTNLADFN